MDTHPRRAEDIEFKKKKKKQRPENISFIRRTLLNVRPWKRSWTATGVFLSAVLSGRCKSSRESVGSVNTRIQAELGGKSSGAVRDGRGAVRGGQPPFIPHQLVYRDGRFVPVDNFTISRLSFVYLLMVLWEGSARFVDLVASELLKMRFYAFLVAVLLPPHVWRRWNVHGLLSNDPSGA